MPKIEQTKPKSPVKPKTTLSSRKKNSLRDRMVPVSSMDDSFVNMSLWGRSASGKTYIASTFPRPSLILAAEDGTKTIRKEEGIEFLRILDVEELPDAVQLAREFKTVIVDTATSFQDLFLAKQLGLDEMPAQSSWGLATQQDYAAVALQLKTFMRDVMKLDSNSVIIAQEREFEAPEGSELIVPHIGAALMPSVASWLYPNSDYIVQTFVRERYVTKTVKIAGKTKERKVLDANQPYEYCARLEPHPIYTTKWRAPVGTKIPGVITDPSYEKFSKYW